MQNTRSRPSRNFVKEMFVGGAAIRLATAACTAAMLCGIPTVAQSAGTATALPLTCFLSDGTLANAIAGQLTLMDPITDSLRYKMPATRKVVGLVCNPKKLQVLLRYEGSRKEKIWEVVSVSSGKAILKDIPFEVEGGKDHYFKNYNKTFYGVDGSTFGNVGSAIAFSADGELLAAYKHFGYDPRVFLSVFDSADFSEIASINLESLLGKGAGYRLMAVNAVNQQYVDIIATTERYARDHVHGKSLWAVRWKFRNGRMDRKQISTDGSAFWNFNPLVGGFIGGENRVITFFGNSDGDSEASERFSSSSSNLVPSGRTYILGRNVGMRIGNRYAADGNTMIEKCPGLNGLLWGSRPYVFKVGESDFTSMPCNTLDPRGHIAVDVQRGYIFNTSKGKPDRLIKIEDFSDVRKTYFDSLQEKYGVFFRKAFVKAQQKERYVPSVSNSKTVSETLFYVGGEPVTRYKDHTTTNEGYNEKVDIYNLVYEVRNGHSKPLAIRFRIEGLAKSTSWEVKTLSGGFWQALLGGGRFSSENVREKEEISLPMKIEKVLILKSGESFKSKDVWGEAPANQDEISIRAIDVQEVEPAWLARLDDLLVGKVSPTRERIDEFLSDSRSSWASEKLLDMHNQFRAEQNKQRTSRLMQNLKIVSVSIPKDYDPDFQNNVALELQNNNAEEVHVTIQVGSTSVDTTVPERGRKAISVIVAGVKKSEVIPSIKNAK